MPHNGDVDLSGSPLRPLAVQADAGSVPSQVQDGDRRASRSRCNDDGRFYAHAEQSKRDGDLHADHYGNEPSPQALIGLIPPVRLLYERNRRERANHCSRSACRVPADDFSDQRPEYEHQCKSEDAECGLCLMT